MNCRHCGEPLTHAFLDLGMAPLSNAYLTAAGLCLSERCFPLKLYVCDSCWLVQTEDQVEARDLFSSEYAYFSSTSTSWLDHAYRYVEMIISRFRLNSKSFVIEIGANDGYLLTNFVDAGIPCLGIEPTASTAAAAERLSIPIMCNFFGKALANQLAKDGKQADLIIGNNVYAHVPDINDFTAGLKSVLKPGGVITLEFQHLLRFIEFSQFDTVYHEHFSYLSLYTASCIFSNAGLRVWDVEELSTHGGSLRVYGCHANDVREDRSTVSRLLDEETRGGLRDLSTFSEFQQRADRIGDDLIEFLVEQKQVGRRVAAYGAAAKGNTLLNYSGVTTEILPYVCDASPSKQGRYLPGTHIPIVSPDELRARRPDVVLILPWNIADEVMSQQSYVREWGGVFVVAVPALRVI